MCVFVIHRSYVCCRELQYNSSIPAATIAALNKDQSWLSLQHMCPSLLESVTGQDDQLIFHHHITRTNFYLNLQMLDYFEKLKLKFRWHTLKLQVLRVSLIIFSAHWESVSSGISCRLQKGGNSIYLVLVNYKTRMLIFWLGCAK